MLQCQFFWRSVKPLPRYDDLYFSKLWLSAILDLFLVRLDQPQRVFGSFITVQKFSWNRCSSFDDVHAFYIICEFGKVGIRRDHCKAVTGLATFSARIVIYLMLIRRAGT